MISQLIILKWATPRFRLCHPSFIDCCSVSKIAPNSIFGINFTMNLNFQMVFSKKFGTAPLCEFCPNLSAKLSTFYQRHLLTTAHTCAFGSLWVTAMFFLSYWYCCSQQSWLWMSAAALDLPCVNHFLCNYVISIQNKHSQLVDSSGCTAHYLLWESARVASELTKRKRLIGNRDSFAQ